MNLKRIYHGEKWFNIREMIEANIKGFIKLEYYTVQELNGNLQYGIEIIKKQYINKEFYKEKSYIKNITDDEIEINKLITKLEKNKVTPIELADIINDSIKQKQNFLFTQNNI